MGRIEGDGRRGGKMGIEGEGKDEGEGEMEDKGERETGKIRRGGGEGR